MMQDPKRTFDLLFGDATASRTKAAEDVNKLFEELAQTNPIALETVTQVVSLGAAERREKVVRLTNEEKRMCKCSHYKRYHSGADCTGGCKYADHCGCECFRPRELKNKRDRRSLGVDKKSWMKCAGCGSQDYKFYANETYVDEHGKTKYGVERCVKCGIRRGSPASYEVPQAKTGTQR